MVNLCKVEKREVHTTRKLDGLVVVAKDWRCLKVVFNVNLYTVLRIERVNLSSFRGLFVRECASSKCFKVGLFKHTNMTVYLVFSIPTSAPEISYLLVSRLIRNTMIEVVEKMEGTSTFMDWNSRVRNHKKELLFMDDVQDFGNRFLLEVQDKLAHMLNTRVTLFTVVSGCGQDCKFSNLDRIISCLFDLNFVKRMAVHHVFDFSKNNSVLVWNRNDLVKLLGRGNLNMEFFVGLINGNGNFYYTLNDNLEEETAFIAEAKFYSQMFKEIHRENSPFMGPEISTKLYDPSELSMGTCKKNKVDWNDLEKQLCVLENNIKDISVKRTDYYSRCELIVVLKDIDGERLISTRVIEAVIDHHSLGRGVLLDCLRSINIVEMREKLETNIIPCINVLKHHVRQRKNVELRTETCLFSLPEFLVCFAAEAIICFAIYGTIKYRAGKYMFPKWIRKALHLDKEDFYEDTNTFTLESNGIRFNENHSLEFHPINLKLMEQVFKNLKSVPLTILQPLDQLYEFFELGTDDLDINLVLNDIASVVLTSLLKSIVYFGRKKSFKILNDNQAWNKLPRNEFVVNFTYKTTTELVNILFNGQHFTRHFFLGWFMKNLLHILDDRDGLIRRLKSKIRDKLEDLLFEKLKPLDFPFIDQGDKKYFRIVPIAGTQNSRYRWIPGHWKVSFVENIERGLGNDIGFGPIIEALNDESLDSKVSFEQFKTICQRIFRSGNFNTDEYGGLRFLERGTLRLGR